MKRNESYIAVHKKIAEENKALKLASYMRRKLDPDKLSSNPTTCSECEAKAIYMFGRVGACRKHKDVVVKAAQKLMIRHDAYFSTFAPASHTKKRYHRT